MRGVMRGASVIGIALLVACAPSAPTGVYRSAGTQIYSNAVFQPERFAGRWVQVADFAPAGAGACRAGGLVVTPAADGLLTVKADLCLGGQHREFEGAAELSGPGRLRLIGADTGGIGAEWWVLWVDDGYRTLVIGTPSGAFGMILNRDPILPPDRMKAARDILAWNGYDLSRLAPVSPP